MFAYDVDGDGDGDVVTSLSAHHYGLSWFEQVEKDGASTFVEHRIMGEPQERLAGDVCFSELHALDLADFDGDGLKDVVTGKRWWSHGPDGGPGSRDPAVLYWWKLRREGGTARFEPHLIDDDSGVGVFVVAGDVDGDGRTDVVVGNKKGTFVHLQRAGKPAAPTRQSQGGGGRGPAPAAALDPRPGRAGGETPVGLDGEPLNCDFESGDLRGWTVEGDAFVGQPIRGDAPARRDRESSLHQGEFWIGGYEQLGDGPQGRLVSAPFQVTKPWASFLVGGGAHEGTAVELVREGEYQAFFRCVGGNFESMQPVAVDLKGELGRTIRIRLVDEEGGGWGHLNFDDFRLHDERPAIVRPSGVPEILEPDRIVHAGLPAAEAARAMTVPPGFRVEPIASEPDLVQPIALAVDGKGRLWVAQALSYPIRQPEGQGKDSILVFEDRDADGSFETRTVFADRLNLVSGLETGFGGVFVGAAPCLYWFPDRDDDLRPDGPPEVLLDGFGYEDTHETLNAFTWGPDGWLYGCHGVFTHSRVGRPGTPDEQRTPMNAAIWRYHPQRRDFEIFCEGTSNPWGVDFDDFGEAFCTACVIPHLYHCVPGGRYARQAGRHFETYTYVEIDTIADHRHWAGSGPYAAIGRSGSVGGGHAHCGALLYLGDRFPAEFRGSLLMGNVHGNRINRDFFERKGSGFVGRHGPDFLVANDAWFRHVSSRLGPDGEIYFIDWYDSHACHQTPAELWNRGNGRLYRVTCGEPAPRTVDVGAMSDAELVAAQREKNEWWVRRARVELQARGLSPSAERALLAMFATHSDPTRRLRAMWALHAAGDIDEGLSRDRLAVDADEHVRAWLVRLLCERRSASPEVLRDLVKLAGCDPSPIVRREIASALQRLPLDDRRDVLAALLRHGEDAADPNLPALYWYALEPLVGADAERGLALARESALPLLRELAVRRAAAEPRCHGALVAALAAEPDAGAQRAMLEQMHVALREQRGLSAPEGWPELCARLRSDPAARRAALSVAIDFGDRSALPELRAQTSDRGADLAWRREALSALVQMQDPQAPGLLLGLVGGAEARRSGPGAPLGDVDPLRAEAFRLAEPLPRRAPRRDHYARLARALREGALACARARDDCARGSAGRGAAPASRALRSRGGRAREGAFRRRARHAGGEGEAHRRAETAPHARLARPRRPDQRSRALRGDLHEVPRALRGRARGRARVDRLESRRPRLPAPQRRRPQRRDRQGLPGHERVPEGRPHRERHPHQGERERAHDRRRERDGGGRARRRADREAEQRLAHAGGAGRLDDSGTDPRPARLPAQPHAGADEDDARHRASPVRRKEPRVLDRRPFSLERRARRDRGPRARRPAAQRLSAQRAGARRLPPDRRGEARGRPGQQRHPVPQRTAARRGRGGRIRRRHLAS
jgi:putative membrane-bound dehydrogenase-like protein